MSEIKDRLKETSEQCLKSFEAWDGDRKSSEARETLQDAIHELRKVTSRLEIELAISERDQMTQKPIPIPPHRASKDTGAPVSDADFEDINDGGGNSNQNSKPKPRRRNPRKASGGNS